ncbi:MAG TPA: hypothetical protein VMM76_07680 [Pirellulaceae bacterium]|nr:hypothetical protein [Pirellulaceae bacterium]
MTWNRILEAYGIGLRESVTPGEIMIMIEADLAGPRQAAPGIRDDVIDNRE